MPFLNSFIRVVRFGEDTKFWQDDWLGELPLCDRFQHLFALVLVKDCLVVDCIVWSGLTYSWTWSWRHSPCGKEAGELASLSLLLRDFVPKRDESGSWSWGLSPQG